MDLGLFVGSHKIVHVAGVYMPGMSTSEAGLQYVSRLRSGEPLGFCHIDYVEPVGVKYAHTSEGEVKLIKFRVVGAGSSYPGLADLSSIPSRPHILDESPLERRETSSSSQELPSQSDLQRDSSVGDTEEYVVFDARDWISIYRVTPECDATFDFHTSNSFTPSRSTRELVEAIIEQKRLADDDAERLHQTIATLSKVERAEPRYDYNVPRRVFCGVDLTNIDQVFYDDMRSIQLTHDEALERHPIVKRRARELRW